MSDERHTRCAVCTSCAEELRAQGAAALKTTALGPEVVGHIREKLERAREWCMAQPFGYSAWGEVTEVLGLLPRPSGPQAPSEPPTPEGDYYETYTRKLQSARAAAAPVPKTPEPLYPCDECDTMRTKAEGGTTFTVCDECWDNLHQPAGAKAAPGAHVAFVPATEEVVASGASYGEVHDAADRLGRLKEVAFEFRKAVASVNPTSPDSSLIDGGQAKAAEEPPMCTCPDPWRVDPGCPFKDQPSHKPSPVPAMESARRYLP